MTKNSFQNNAFQYDENDNIKNYDLNSIEFDKSVHKKDDHSLKDDELIDENLTSKDKLLILVLGLTIFTCFAGSSVVSPFLPRVAEQKGLSITKYSYIFAVYEFVGFLLPPLACKIAIRMTPKVFLITSMFVFSCCSTIFGFLIYAKGGNTFFILCIIVRICWSCSGASAKTAIYMCCTILFPRHICVAFSAIEIGAGAGFMLGPALGGYLYEIGGFPLPFIVNSILCLLSILPCYLLIKNDVKPKKNDEKETSIIQLLSVPGVSLNLFISTITCLCFGYNNSTMDYNLRSIMPDIKTSEVGKVMLVSGFIYSVFTYIFGYICDKYKKSYYLIFPGLIFLSICYIYIGPLYLLWFMEPSIRNVVISQCFFGLGMASVIVMSFDEGVKEAKKYLPSNDSTMACYSSLVTCSYALGAATGPFLASITVEKFGFRISTIFCLASLIILTLMTILYVLKIKKDVIKTDKIKTVS